MSWKLGHKIVRLIRIGDSLFWNWLRSNDRNSNSDQIVYDIGLHVGQDTKFYLKKGFRVVAVEANPELADKARIRFSRALSVNRLSVVNCGISGPDVDTHLDFYVNKELSEWSSFEKSLACRGGHRHHIVKVECRTLASVIEQFGLPFYIKIDIEGNDLVALWSVLEAGYRPKYISVENGNCGMLSMLVNAGYDRFKYVQQKSVHRQRAPYPSLHGKYIKYPFSKGASGLFGEEAPGDWLTNSEVRKKISKVWDPDSAVKNPGHDDQIHGWFDLHARFPDEKRL